MSKIIKEPLYSLSDCSFNYGKNAAIDRLNLNLVSNTFYGIVGPNGSGKTTLLDLLLGLHLPTSGSIQFQDNPLQSFSKAGLAKQIGVVPQEFSLSFDFSVYDVVMMGRHPHLPRFGSPGESDHHLVEDNLKLLGIWELRDRPASLLSGGEKQRTVVARALTQDCPVLLLDEATSNLDIQHTIDIMRILRTRVNTGNLTVIASIHDLNLVTAFCDHVIALQDGSLRAFGPTSEIITSDLIQSLFNVSSKIHQKPDSETVSIHYDYRK